MASDTWLYCILQTKGGIPWCTLQGIPPLLIDNLWMARYMTDAHIGAFCILPDRMELLIEPGKDGVKRFVDMFQVASVRDAQVVAGLLMTDKRLFRGWQKEYEVQGVTLDNKKHIASRIENAALRFGLVRKTEEWQWSSRWYGRSTLIRTEKA